MGKLLGGGALVGVAAGAGALLVAQAVHATRNKRAEKQKAQERQHALDEVDVLGMGCVGSTAVKEGTATQAPASDVPAVPAPAVHQVRPKVTVSATDKAVLDLKLQRDKMNQCRKRLAGQADKDRQVALELVRAGHKDRAMVVLQRKKLAEKSLVSADNQLIQLEEMVMSIETKENEAAFLKGIAEGTTQLKKLNEQLKYEDVDKLLQDNQDQIAYQNEIAELVNGNIDEAMNAEIEADLELLRQEMAAEAMTAAPQAPSSTPHQPLVDLSIAEQGPDTKTPIAM